MGKAPSSAADALHEPLDKYRGAEDWGEALKRTRGCTAEAELSEKGMEVGGGNHTGAVGGVWGWGGRV